MMKGIRFSVQLPNHSGICPRTKVDMPKKQNKTKAKPLLTIVQENKVILLKEINVTTGILDF